MAPALQCPDCSTKHPLAEVPAAGTFGCRGCGRMLKVPGGGPAAPPVAPVAPVAPAPVAPPPVAPVAPAPVVQPPVAPIPEPPVERVLASAVVGASAPAVAAAAVPPPGPDATAVLPETASPAPKREKRRVAWWLVLCLWIVAVPAGFLIVFLVARVTGLFTSDQLSDIFLASGVDRFWPLARLVPLVALVTALIVQIGVAALARRRRPVRQAAGDPAAPDR